MPQFKLHLLLAKRLSRDKEHNLSRPIVNISIIGVALGIIIMILATSITEGYKNEIRQKVVAMGSHIQISNYDNNYSFEPVPFEREQFFMSELEQHPDILNIQFFSTKVGIVKTDNQVEGIVLKGIDTTYCWEMFDANLKEGTRLQLSEDTPAQGILISSKLSKKLQIAVDDKLRVYFVQEPLKQRSFTVTGIFETGLPEFDDSFALVDLRHVQKLNDWDSTLVGGIEILISDYDQIDEIGDEVHHLIGYQLKAETIKQIYPQLFEWINLFDTNVFVLLAITIFVCVITLISTFFITALEQTSTIGILKTMGLKNSGIVTIFTLMGMKILMKGVLIGNAIAITFTLLQHHFQFLKLDPETYYVDFVPMEINVITILLINVVAILICTAVLAVSAFYISKKITPVKAIRYD